MLSKSICARLVYVSSLRKTVIYDGCDLDYYCPAVTVPSSVHEFNGEENYSEVQELR